MKLKIKPRQLVVDVALVTAASLVNPWVAPLAGNETIGLVISFVALHLLASSLFNV